MEKYQKYTARFINILSSCYSFPLLPSIGGICPIGHLLLLKQGRRWFCDGRKDPKLGGCCAEMGDIYDTNVPSYKCVTCDYDLCTKCYLLLPKGQ